MLKVGKLGHYVIITVTVDKKNALTVISFEPGHAAFPTRLHVRPVKT